MTAKKATPAAAKAAVESFEISEMNLWQRLHSAAHEVSGMQKDVSVSGGGMNYKGISHDSVIKSARSVLYKYRITALSSVVSAVDEIFEYVNHRGDTKTQHKSTYGIETTFTNIDVPTERDSVITYGIGLDSQDKSAGKAQSYAKKYGFQLALQMFTGDGDEARIEDDHGQHRVSTRTSQSAAMPKAASDASVEFMQKLRTSSAVTDEMNDAIDKYLRVVMIGTSYTQDRVSATIEKLKAHIEKSKSNADVMKDISANASKSSDKKNPTGDEMPF